MRSDALDITIESRHDALWISLAGPFHNEQGPNIREKIEGLLSDGAREFILNLQGVTEVDSTIVETILKVLNTVRSKHGELRLVFRNEAVTKAFSPYRHLFLIYPDSQSVEGGGVFGALRRQSRTLFRKTGIRISRPVALFLLFALCGWFLSLLFIIHLQNKRISEQSTLLHTLSQDQINLDAEVTALRERVRPLEQLGLILPDSSRN